MSKLPKISVIFFVYNEEKNLRRLFASLKKQSYPRSRLEYILVNDSSTDKSRELARDFGARIIDVETHDIDINKGIGLHAATGDLIYWMDADMEVTAGNFFELISKPLENSEIVGSYASFALNNKSRANSLVRFLSFDVLQRDPIYQLFSKSVESTVIKKSPDFYLCKYEPGDLPPSGMTMYRRKEILGIREVRKSKSFIDLETLDLAAREIGPFFAFVPKATITHFHAESLKQLLRKRLRNLNTDYLPNIENKKFTWFNIDSKTDAFKIIGWVLWANLVIPELLRGILATVKHKDLAGLWQPVVSLAITDTVIYGFLSKKKGRQTVYKLLFSVVS